MNTPPDKNGSTSSPGSGAATRERPKWLRALGDQDVPQKITVGDAGFDHVRTYKHDSWAATALYECGSRLIVCKFNRQQSIYGLPARWIGLFLANRERSMLIEFADIPNIPNDSGVVKVNGIPIPTATAHEYIPGQPLSWKSEVDDRFWSTLRHTLSLVHDRNIAYVDLHKLENVIVDEQGQPHLIDFQISVKIWNVWPLSAILTMLQRSDIYHLDKHQVRMGPDPDAPINRPWWIRVHRLIAVPFRTARRFLLTVIGVRSKGGHATTEHFVEEGLTRKHGQEHRSEDSGDK